jgi:hypothetical protein
MKFLKTLVVFVTILCANLAHSQSVTPAFQDPVYGGWMHSIMPQSGTFRGNVDLGPLSSMVRSISIRHQSAPADQWIVVGVTTVTSSGIDQFNVPFPSGGNGYFDVMIIYSGVGGWTQTIMINGVRSRQVPQLQIGDNNNGFYCIGYILYVPVLAANYASGEQNYDSKVVLEYESAPGVWTYYDEYEQNGAIGTLDSETFQVYLPGPPTLPSPLLCFRTRTRFQVMVDTRIPARSRRAFRQPLTITRPGQGTSWPQAVTLTP